MNRTGRLLELMILLNREHKFTVQEMATRFAVSRRTMLRDLQLLSEMGVPLSSVPGPHGGYSLIRSQQLPPISLTAEEAISLLLSLETLEEYPDGPFQTEKLSTLTKIRSVLHRDVLAQVDALRERIGMDIARRSYRAPHLRAILEAATKQQHVEIEYESGSRRSRRRILPYGLIAAGGFWYCPSYCYTRGERVWFRADRILAVYGCDYEEHGDDDDTSVAPNMTIQGILTQKTQHRPTTTGTLPLHVTLTPLGCKLGDSHRLFGKFIQIQPDGTGLILDEIAPDNIPMFGRFLLGLGGEMRVHAPQELTRFLADEAQRILYHLPPETAPSS